MKTIMGLGNPGTEYQGTRHNIGREIAGAIAKKFEFHDLEATKKYLGLFSKGRVGTEDARILLPDTFMNASGKAVLALKPRAKDLIVIHDDSDILLGSCKISFGRNSGGHKGVESIMRALKTKDFWRIRVGIQKKKRVDAMKLILQKFTPTEQLTIKKLSKKIIELFEKPLGQTTLTCD